jgi:hypothetical protein
MFEDSLGKPLDSIGRFLVVVPRQSLLAEYYGLSIYSMF